MHLPKILSASLMSDFSAEGGVPEKALIGQICELVLVMYATLNTYHARRVLVWKNQAEEYEQVQMVNLKRCYITDHI